MDFPDPLPGPGQVRIAVRAAGGNPSDRKKRQGPMDEELPQTMGHEAAGVVDELGEGVADVAVGDRVFGFSTERRPRSSWRCCPITRRSRRRLTSPALPRCRPPLRRPRARLTSSASEAAARCSSTAPPEASAVPRFSSPWCAARVIGTAGPANHDYLRSLGAEPVAYGGGFVERVRALAPDGADVALDVAGSGVLPELIGLAGGPGHVVTVADFSGAQEHGVAFSSGDADRAVHVLAEIGELIEAGRFSFPVARTFPRAEIAEAQRVSEQGHVRGKLVLLVG